MSCFKAWDQPWQKLQPFWRRPQNQPTYRLTGSWSTRISFTENAWKKWMPGTDISVFKRLFRCANAIWGRYQVSSSSHKRLEDSQDQGLEAKCAKWVMTAAVVGSSCSESNFHMDSDRTYLAWKSHISKNEVDRTCCSWPRSLSPRILRSTQLTTIEANLKAPWRSIVA